MEVKIITGTPEEIAKVLQAIENSKEQKLRDKKMRSVHDTDTKTGSIQCH